MVIWLYVYMVIWRWAIANTGHNTACKEIQFKIFRTSINQTVITELGCGLKVQNLFELLITYVYFQILCSRYTSGKTCRFS